MVMSPQVSWLFFEARAKRPYLDSYGSKRATRKNSQLAAARRVALKMGRRPRCSSVTYQFRYAPSTASPARTALPTAHFERNDVIIFLGYVAIGAFRAVAFELRSPPPKEDSRRIEGTDLSAGLTVEKG
jgi:hypothetical protein